MLVDMIIISCVTVYACVIMWLMGWVMVRAYTKAQSKRESEGDE